MAFGYYISSLVDRSMQLFSRPAVLQSVMLSLFSFPLVKNDPASSSPPPPMVSIESPQQHQTKGTLEYHEPPKVSLKDNEDDDDDSNKNTFYDDNWTVFGKILRGESPAITYAETDHLLAFEDMHPRAPLHALIIPKRFIGSVFDLESSLSSQSTSHQVPNDLALLEEMQNMAEQMVQEQHPIAYKQGDYTLCFHIPPFNSVDHLHLHVLAPASHMKAYFRFVKYQTGTVWCTSLMNVLERLRTGKPAVPYSRPSRKTPLVDFLY
jgi:diadenosine tetraphosphate (Ap4A) HIT family hydrolase